MEAIEKKESVEKEVRRILCEALERPDVEDIENLDDLQEAGMDSLNCIALMVGIEEAFNIEIADEQLGMEYVGNIDSICRLIKDYLK